MKQRFATVFGALGYIAVLLEWLWVVTLTVPWLIEDKDIKKFFLMSTPTAEPVHSAWVAPAPIVIVFTVILSVIIVVLGIWAAAKAPKRLVKITSRTTHTAAEKIALRITYHHHLPVKKLFVLTERIVRLIKLGLVTVPVLLVWLVTLYVPVELDSSLVLFVGAYLAIWPLVWFSLQAILLWDESKRSAL